MSKNLLAGELDILRSLSSKHHARRSARIATLGYTAPRASAVGPEQH